MNDISERTGRKYLSISFFKYLSLTCIAILISLTAWNLWTAEREIAALQQAAIEESEPGSAGDAPARALSEAERVVLSRNRLLLPLSLILIVLLMCQFILERRFMWRPLLRCTEFAQNIVSGKYDAQLASMELREFDTLITALNRMKDNIFTDPLTGARSRAALAHHFDYALREFSRYGIPFTLLLFDVDYFKRVNDTYGHLVGDLCLKHIIEVTQSMIRRSDNVYRIGGEEFVCLLPKTELSGALIVAEKVRSAVEQTPLEHEGNKISLTMSIGVTGVELGETFEAVVARADKRMYAAKRSGRNRIVHMDDPQGVKAEK
jgi:diguanylate cyclase (GGDEF)-like protein